jgi:hypothetical protein
MADKKQEGKAKLKAILDENNVELSWGGCGCCGSPWVSLKIDGETYIDNAEGVDFDSAEDHA